ncbi:hypothetical protein B0H10DRAFT_2012409 [Mycena sp. CBHHK59/15]|nr:hypothetical protein B0H10DRAFT_2012409 [Mycena sp. CBHHK59/15]
MLTVLRMSQEQCIDDKIPLDDLDHLLEDLAVTDTARLSPTPCEISKIPPEIISEIFLLCLPFSGICFLLDVWLTRAGRCPLSITIRRLENNNRDHDEELHPVSVAWKVIERFARQVEFLAINLAFEELEDLRFLEGWFPSLKSLFVSAQRRRRWDGTFVPLNMFKDCPTLEDATLGTYQCSTAVSLPWSRLKFLSMFSLDEVECLEKLQQAPNLTRCIFYNLPNDGQLLPRVPPLTHIQSFHLIIGEHHIWLLEALTLPALRDLTLSMRADEVPRFHAFLSRCSCRLRSLRLTTEMHDTSLLQCFRHAAMLSLERLKVTAEGPNTCTTIYRALRDDGDFFPVLRSLEIYEWLPDASLDSEVGYDVLLLDALYARWKSARRLRHFQLQTSRLNLKVPDASKLRTMYEQGMLINVETYQGTVGDVKVRRIWTLADTEK